MNDQPSAMFAEPQALFQAMVALLFAASAPVEFAQLAEVLEQDEATLKQLVANPPITDFGLVLQQQGESVQLVTEAKFGSVVKRLLRLEGVQDLTKAAKETLAVVAYHQPVDRTTIEKLRGLDCRRTLATLMQKGLVQQSHEVPEGGDPRAFYYEVSLTFLEHFGLPNVEALRQRLNQGESLPETDS